MQKLKEIRQTILQMTHDANVSHVGSALSVVDILYTLYFEVINIIKKSINSNDRDIVILSKGHASAALYSVLYHKGFITKKDIESYAVDGGMLPCHIDKAKSPFFEISSGSLGHGLGVGAGMALAKKLDGNQGRVYVICGDGECNEGSIWEALMFASTNHLNNLTLIVDFNKLQGFGTTNEIINQFNLEERMAAFGFDTYSVDGHDINTLKKILLKTSNKPLAIVAHTIKGKGVSFMEDRCEWHYKSPNDEQLNIALKEIEGRY
ncbi:transketolase [Helicobacter sp. 11S02629-2]|uniref:transketolase n=1 Tax=Helicobacter sp. 11S02629-2 TaxID=1476195 RepID=UPI000BA53E27|nr:transketolase [Helicobacter sp. 11S02629-2]PAF44656.1 transketolase [Helicobacter sp. 11S02629-2]